MEIPAHHLPNMAERLRADAQAARNALIHPPVQVGPVDQPQGFTATPFANAAASSMSTHDILAKIHELARQQANKPGAAAALKAYIEGSR